MFTRLFQPIRRLFKTPAFVLTAIAIVAIGISLTTTAISVVDALIYRPPPAEDASEIARVYSSFPDGAISPPNFRDIQEQASFPVFSYAYESGVQFARQQTRRLVLLGEVSGNLFRGLGWRMELGRPIEPDDDAPGSEPVAALAYRFWRNELGADPAIVGKLVTLNGRSFRVIGVVEPKFDRLDRLREPEVWIPHRHVFADWKLDNRNWRGYSVTARISSDRSLASADLEAQEIAARLREQYRVDNHSLEINVVPERKINDSSLVARSLTVLGVVASLLLVACFNLGNMLLANAYRRQREFAIRRSVGASPRHLFAQLLGESLSISLIGGLVGGLLAVLLLRQASSLLPAAGQDFGVSWSSLAIAGALATLTGLVSGAVPALQMSLSNTHETMKRGSRGSGMSKATSALLVGQIAISLALLVCAAFFYLSLRASWNYEPGHRTDNLVYFETSMQSLEKNDKETVPMELKRQLEALPGVVSVGISTLEPLAGTRWTYVATDRFKPAEEPDQCSSAFAYASHGYMETMEIPILEGRDLEESDYSWWNPQVALINESFRDRFWPDGGAIGSQFYPWGREGEATLRVVGVYRDFSTEPWKETKPMFLVPQPVEQNYFTVKSEGPTASALLAIERLARDFSPEVTATAFQSYDEAMRRVFNDVLVTLVILGVLGGAGVLLSFVGIWQATRQHIQQRRKELIIRLAIGAPSQALLWKAIGRCMKLNFMGLAAGAAVSFVIARLIRHAYQGVSYTNLAVYLVAVAFLGVVAFVACYFPASSVLRMRPRQVLDSME